MIREILRFEVVSSDGHWRLFATFEEAERWSRQHVASSAGAKFAVNASIYGDPSAYVSLDGANRVWTDLT